MPWRQREALSRTIGNCITLTLAASLIIMALGLLMKILAVGYVAMAVTQSLSGVMRGAGDTVTPMWISILTTVVIRVPLAYGIVYLTKTPQMPAKRGWHHENP